MDVNKMKYVKENSVKVYNCTFQLQLFELRIFLRFSGKFFVEWKTSNGSNQIRTQGFAQNIDAVTLNINDIRQFQEHMDQKRFNNKHFNQLAGRINIDLSRVCQKNPYKNPITQSLTFTSTSADLKFALTQKYSIQSKKSVSQLNLLDFSDRLYLNKQNDSLNKSKSFEYLKNMQESSVSPVFQIKQLSKLSPIKQKPLKQNKPTHFPLSKLASYGHQVQQVITNQPDQQNFGQFGIRMTLGNESKNLSNQLYKQIINQQSKGMKKSDLMIVPDMKKSRVQDQDSQFNTQQSKKTSQQDVINPKHLKQQQRNRLLKKSGSQDRLKKRQKSPQSSDIDIVVDLSDLQSNMKIQQNARNLKNSLNSSKSFSISKFRAQYQNQTQQNFFNKTKSPKQSMTSVQMPNFYKNTSAKQIQQISQKYQASKNRIKQLQNDVSQLVKMLTTARQNSQKQQKKKQQHEKTIQQLNFQNSQLHKKIDQLKQKVSYQTKINQLNCQKLKKVSSQLTLQKHRSTKSNLMSSSFHAQQQLNELKQKCKRLQFEKGSLQQKLYKRDQIQLQNQIRIQELEEQLIKFRTQKLNNVPKIAASALQLQSKIVKNQSKIQKPLVNEQESKQSIKDLQQMIKNLQKQNTKIKDMCNQAYKTIQLNNQKDQRMRQNILIIEQQFKKVVNQLMQKQKILKQKSTQAQSWKKKSYIAAYNASATQQLKHKQTQQQLLKANEMIKFYQNQLLILQQQNDKLQSQNKQLISSKLLKQSFRYQGDLKVIKQQQSFRQSFASSGENFKINFNNNKLNLIQENIIAIYKQSIQSYFNKNHINQQFQLNFTGEINDLRKKIFNELERSSKIINQLLFNNQLLALQLSQATLQKDRAQQQLQNKLKQLQTKIDQIQQQSKISAGSTNLAQFTANNFLKPQQDKADQYSQATKKRSSMSLNTDSKLNRQVQKLKSIIYDKNKQMSDLIASYEKLKLQKQTQSMLIKSKKVQFNRASSLNNDQDKDAQLVHDIIDLQIRLTKQKEHKNQLMEELSLQKSLNKSQQGSQYVHQFDISQTYKQIRAIITSRQNFITTQESLKRLVKKINQLQEASQRVDKDYKLVYLVQEKSRSISKQIQVLKSNLFKMNFKDIQPIQHKSLFANALKPCQQALTELLVAIEEMVNNL